MANEKVSALTTIGTVSSGDYVYIVDISPSLASNKATVAQLVTGLPNATGSTAGLMSSTDKSTIDAASSSATANTLMARDSSGNTIVNQITCTRAFASSPPSASTELVNKAYADAVSSGLHLHDPAVAATTANVTLVGGAPSSIDSIGLNANDRILVKDQTDPKQNGIYVVQTLGTGANGTWVRSADADTGAELTTGTYIFVSDGTLWGSSSWVMTTAGTIVLGTSNIVWTLFSQVTSVQASDIIGQIVANQVADGAINTAKFALTIKPIEIVSSLPVSNLVQGRTVFLTTDNKLYRYTGSAWISTLAAADITGQLADAQIAALAASKVTGTLTNSQIADLAAAKITGQITTTQITDSAISTPKLAAGSVSTAKIAAGAVTANEIAAATITATQIAAGTITSAKIAAGTIQASNIAADTITGDKIAANAITSDELAANSVIAGKVAAAAISTSELAAGAINTSKLAAGAVTTDKIAANTILAGNIAAGTITGSEIAAGTITASHINVSSLSAISANIGSVTAGAISVGAGNLNTVVQSGLLKQGNIRIETFGTVASSTMYVHALGGSLEFWAYSAAIPAVIMLINGSGTTMGYISSEGSVDLQTIKIGGTDALILDGSPKLRSTGLRLAYSDGDKCNLIADEVDSDIEIFCNGKRARIPITFV